MEWLDGVLAAEGYEVGRQILQRGVAAVYLIGFLSAVVQFPALLGENGLLPVPRFLELAGKRAGPTIFRWRYSDRILLAVAWAGCAISALLVLGLPQTGPPWLPMLAFLVIWALYLSIVNVGQVFYGIRYLLS